MIRTHLFRTRSHLCTAFFLYFGTSIAFCPLLSIPDSYIYHSVLPCQQSFYRKKSTSFSFIIVVPSLLAVVNIGGSVSLERYCFAFSLLVLGRSYCSADCRCCNNKVLHSDVLCFHRIMKLKRCAFPEI